VQPRFASYPAKKTVMPTQQITLRFKFPIEPGQLKVNRRLWEQWFNEFKPTHTYHPTELLAQLLRRQARIALYEITNCAPHLIAVHLRQLRDLCDLIDLACRHSLVAVEEQHLSTLAKTTPTTVMDYRACLDHAMQHHRSPIPIANDEVLARIDILARHIANLNFVHSATSDSPTIANHSDAPFNGGNNLRTNVESGVQS
jgi:hypothetical protein